MHKEPVGVLQPELDEPLGAGLIQLGLQSSAADEVAPLLSIDREPETGFERRVLILDVVEVDFRSA